MAELTTVEPVRLQVVRFKCPFCPRSYARKKPAVEHIARCWRNPGLRSCLSCTFHELTSFGELCFADVDLEAKIAAGAFPVRNCESWGSKDGAPC